jgi:hypothetical protein
MRLTKGMYGTEFDKDSLFGIHCGQIRYREVVHNGGWYNSVGEKIGWGDLSSQDFKKISSELQPGEVFIIVGEQDSFWSFVSFDKGAGTKIEDKEQSPGINYVIEHARWAILPNQIYHVTSSHDSNMPKKADQGMVNYCGFEHELIDRKLFKAIIDNPKASMEYLK